MTGTKTINDVIRRDGSMCVIRGPFCTVHATVADHRANRGQGGSLLLDDPANLVGACVLCNGWKEDATGEDRARLVLRGLRLPKRATNAQTLVLARAVPVMWPDGTWWVLGPRRVQIPRAEALEILAVFGLLPRAVAGGA